RAVAAAVAEAQDARVAAGTRLEPRGDRVEQLRHDVAILDVLQHETSRVQRAAVGAALGEAALGDGDDPLDEGPELLRLGDRGLDMLVADQPLRRAAQHRHAMLGDAAKLPMSYSMAHVPVLAGPKTRPAVGCRADLQVRRSLFL